MTVTITRLYDDYASAEEAVRDLEAAGVPHNDISIVSNNADSWYKGSSRAGTTVTPRTTTGRVDRDHDGVDDRAEGAGAGGGIGATLGGAAGLLAGLGLLAIPGLGPVVAFTEGGTHDVLAPLVPPKEPDSVPLPRTPRSVVQAETPWWKKTWVLLV